MDYFEINKNDSEDVVRLKSEANLAINLRKERGEDRKAEDIFYATQALEILYQYSGEYKDLYAYINCMHDYVKYGIFSPLTFTEGEFIFRKPGLSQNRRNPFVYKDLKSIYYSLAYYKKVVQYYDAKNNLTSFSLDKDKEKGIDSFTGDEKRLYLVKGGILTNIYFNKAYLKQKSVNEGWFPKASITIDVIRYIYEDKYIDYCIYNNPKVHSLFSFYDIELFEDDNQELMKFGTKFNIKKDGLSR